MKVLFCFFCKCGIMQEAIFSGKDICNLKAIGRVILSAILLVLTGLMIAFAKAAPDVVFSFYPALSRGILSAISSKLMASTLTSWCSSPMSLSARWRALHALQSSSGSEKLDT